MRKVIIENIDEEIKNAKDSDRDEILKHRNTGFD